MPQIKTTNPVFSVIVCTYERHNDLRKCLKSILKQKFQDFEIIVVAPEHDRKSISVAERFPKVKIVKQKYGKGLSIARNLGIAASSGKYITLIDDDAEAKPNWLNNFYRCYNDEKIGAIGGLVYGAIHKEIQFKNGSVNILGDITYNESYSHEDYNNPDGFWLNNMMGTNCSFRRDVLQKVGGFDINYRYYFDETELCLRIIRAGYKIAHANDAIVYHKMAEGINRKGYWDNNWTQILKNTMVFSITNFYSKAPLSLKIKILTHPLLVRLKEFYTAKKHAQISTIMMLKIWARLFRGHSQAISETIIHKYNRKKNWIPEKLTLEIILSDPNKPPDDLNICLVSREYPPGKIGGVGRYTHILAKKLAEKGHNIHVITSQTDEGLLDGVHIHRIEPPLNGLVLSNDFPIVKRNLGYSLEVFKKIKELSQNEDFDIIEFPLWDIEGFTNSFSKDIPMVVRVETPIFKVAEINNWTINDDIETSIALEKKFLENSDGIIAISENIKKTISDHYDLKNNDWYRGPIGIPTNTKSNTSNSKTILFVGRLEKRKGADILIKAIPFVLKKHHDTKFYFVGSDTDYQNNSSFKNYMISLIDKKYFENVEFYGYVDDKTLDDFYSKCSLFVAPSIYESFGIIFLEAMNTAKPVIGTTAGGIPEVVESGKTGFLVEPGNEKELAEKIIYILDNPEEGRKMGKNGKKRLEELFSDEKFANDSLTIYSQVITKVKTSDSSNYKQSAQESIWRINSG